MPIIITCVCVCVETRALMSFHLLSSQWISVCLNKYSSALLFFHTTFHAQSHFSFNAILLHVYWILCSFSLWACVYVCVWLFYLSHFNFHSTLSIVSLFNLIYVMSTISTEATTGWHIKFFNVFLSVTSVHGQYSINIRFSPLNR